MVAVKPADVDGILARPPRVPTVLVFGPDAGLVSERVAKLVSLSADVVKDPFQLVRMDGDLLSQDPMRLVDEAGTISMFGGKRIIVVRVGSKNITPAIKPILETPPRDALIVIHAGDLPRSSPLRMVCERSVQALAIPCYPDGPREIYRLVDDLVQGHGLNLEPDARSHLASLLGADRQTTRNEIEKLALFARGMDSVNVEVVDSICGDAAALAVDMLVDGAFLGQFQQLDIANSRLLADGSDAGILVGFLLRHGLSLLAARSQVDSGISVEIAIAKMKVHFRRKDAVVRQLRIWRVNELFHVTRDLGKAIANCRRIASRSDEISRVSMWSVTMHATNLRARAR